MSVRPYTRQFHPQRAPGTRWVGDWMSPTASLDILKTGRSLAPAGIETPECPDRSLVTNMLSRITKFRYNFKIRVKGMERLFMKPH
jgi:hypothetical protein